MKPFITDKRVEQTAEKSAVKGSAKPTGFQKLESVLKRKESGNPNHHKPAPGGQQGHQTRVETIEEDGFVVKIIVRCQCGEVTEIDCGYAT